MGNRISHFEKKSTMQERAGISTPTFVRNVIAYGMIAAFLFLVLLIVMRLFMKNISGLVAPVDCLALWAVSFFQIRRIARVYGGGLRFLRAFSLVFFTGVVAFCVFGVLMILYAMIDPNLPQAFMARSREAFYMPVFVIVGEGIGGCIIVALLGTFYSDRFLDREIDPAKTEK